MCQDAAKGVKGGGLYIDARIGDIESEEGLILRLTDSALLASAWARDGCKITNVVPLYFDKEGKGLIQRTTPTPNMHIHIYTSSCLQPCNSVSYVYRPTCSDKKASEWPLPLAPDSCLGFYFLQPANPTPHLLFQPLLFMYNILYFRRSTRAHDN